MALEIEPQEIEILESVDIPPRPKALMTISEEAKKAVPAFPVIAQAIVEDPGISAAVLRIINSPAFRRPNPISAVSQALNLLGFKRVLSIVNAVAVKQTNSTGQNLDVFWDYAATVANACVHTCKALERPDLADDSYTLGLFHSAGAPIMMTRFDDYEGFYNASESNGWTLSIASEKEKYKTTHTTIGALMAQDWSLPEAIVNTIYNLHFAEGIFESGDLDTASLDLMGILKIARHISNQYLDRNISEDEWGQVENQILTHFDLSEYQMLDLEDVVINKLGEE